jgi:hypothetical protein
VIEMRVRDDDRIEPARINWTKLAIALLVVAVALKHAAIDEKSDFACLNQIA